MNGGGSRIPSLDGFRGLAILGVLVTHCLRTLLGEARAERYSYLGSWGVGLFFVISGFLITTLLLREREREQGRTPTRTLIARFYLRRAFRILPVAYVYVAVLWVMNHYYPLNISGWNFVTAAFYLQNVVDGSWFLGHFWSLSAEEQYYLLIPALLALGVALFRRWLLVLLVLAHVAMIVYDRVPLGGASVWVRTISAILGNQVQLLVGSLTALLYARGQLRAPRLGTMGCMALLLVSLDVYARWLPVVPTRLSELASGLCFAALLLAAIQPAASLFHRALNARGLMFLGTLSYSLYIWQELFTANQVIYRSASNVRTLAVNLAMLAVVAFASWRLVEQPFIRLKDRYWK